MAKIPEYIHFRVKAYGSDITVEDANDIEFAPVIHGRWIDRRDGYTCCSVCGEDAINATTKCGCGEIQKTPFCPYCGAKLDAKQPYEPATLTVIPAEEMTEQDKSVKAEALKTVDNEKGV